MIKRKIIEIDESLCDGCALCIPSCPEGALQIIDGKAKLVKESFCDGLGACLGDCPQGALRIVDAYTDDYDEARVIEHIKTTSPDKLKLHLQHLDEHKHNFPKKQSPTGGCPSAGVMQFEPKPSHDSQYRLSSQLRQWPIQLHLVPPTAPYFRDANIVLAADCVPFAYANFHQDFLKGNAVAIGCPKLDDVNTYFEKLSQIFHLSKPKSIKVVVMQVPCCSGLVQLAHQAAIKAQIDIDIEVIVISIQGEIIDKRIMKTKMESEYYENVRR